MFRLCKSAIKMQESIHKKVRQGEASPNERSVKLISNSDDYYSEKRGPLPFLFFVWADSYMMMADVDSRSMQQCWIWLRLSV